MKSVKVIFIFVNLFYSLILVARTQTYTIRGHSLSLNKPHGYQLMEGYLGRDFVLLGPEVNKKRETIFIEVTNSERINLENEKKNLAKFEKIKREWIRKKNGKLFSIKLNLRKLKSNKNFLYNQLTYRLGDHSFIEGDIFIECSSRTSLSLSYLVLQDTFTKFKPTLEALIKSISCS